MISHAMLRVAAGFPLRWPGASFRRGRLRLLLASGRVYFVRSGGILTALNAATGKSLYSERLCASGQYSASPILANGHLYLASEPGQITVVKAGYELKIVHQVKLGDKVHVTPALDSNTIYVRGEKHLWAFRSE